MSLEVNLCNVQLRNPTILASGVVGVSKPTYTRMGREGAGAVTIKSLCHEERFGNPNPTMFGFEGGFINAVGLPGQGIDVALKDFGRLDDLNVPVIGSIYGYTVKQFGSVTRKMASLKPALIEVDVSCPHQDYPEPYYADAKLAAKVTKEVKRNSGKIPVSIKLSPNVHDIAAIARAVEKAGANAITAINTVSGMVIDTEVRKPVLAHGWGGVSGPALKPIALYCVHQIYNAVKIPIIGTGGVTYGKDAIEMIMAGATAVGVGTAVYYRGFDVFKKIGKEMESWMKKRSVRSLREIRGAVHEK